MTPTALAALVALPSPVRNTRDDAARRRSHAALVRQARENHDGGGA